MKSFWDDMFFDMRECGVTETEFAEKAGKSIREDLNSIRRAILDHDGKIALELISEFEKNY